MKCPQCGNENNPGAKFCAFCGKPLAMEDATITAQPQPVPLGLAIIAGPNTGKQYALGAETRIGRELSNQVVLETRQASRLHAIIKATAAGYEVEDPGSTNGTFVNGQRVTQPALLHKGDILTIGDVQLQVVDRPGRASQPAQSFSQPTPTAPPQQPAYTPPPAAYSPPPASLSQPVEVPPIQPVYQAPPASQPVEVPPVRPVYQAPSPSQPILVEPQPQYQAPAPQPVYVPPPQQYQAPPPVPVQAPPQQPAYVQAAAPPAYAKPPKKKRGFLGTCLIILIILFVLCGALAGVGYLAINQGWLSTGNLTKLAYGYSQISIGNLQDGDLYYELNGRDSETSEVITMDSMFIGSMEFDGTSQVLPGPYRVVFTPGGGAALECILDVKRGEEYQFIAVPGGIAISEASFEATTQADLLVPTSPLCTNPAP